MGSTFYPKPICYTFLGPWIWPQCLESYEIGSQETLGVIEKVSVWGATASLIGPLVARVRIKEVKEEK